MSGQGNERPCWCGHSEHVGIYSPSEGVSGNLCHSRRRRADGETFAHSFPSFGMTPKTPLRWSGMRDSSKHVATFGSRAWVGGEAFKSWEKLSRAERSSQELKRSQEREREEGLKMEASSWVKVLSMVGGENWKRNLNHAAHQAWISEDDKKELERLRRSNDLAGQSLQKQARAMDHLMACWKAKGERRWGSKEEIEKHLRRRKTGDTRRRKTGDTRRRQTGEENWRRKTGDTRRRKTGDTRTRQTGEEN